MPDAKRTRAVQRLDKIPTCAALPAHQSAHDVRTEITGKGDFNTKRHASMWR
jgi:hypothetical protein